MGVSKEVALVTGASRGIGKAIATRMLQEGWQVVITGRDLENLEQCRKSLSEEVLAIQADVSSLTDTQRVVEATISKFGHIDVLINNAGISGAGIGPIWQANPQDWWQTMEVNLRGLFNHMHTVLPYMIAQKNGTIFNIGSYAGIRPLPNASDYSTSKAGVARLTDSIAEEVSEFGIDLFCISPGVVKTDMTRGLPIFKDFPESAWNPPEKICELIVNLLKRDCSILSGRFIHVDDDLDDLLRQVDKVKSEGLYQLGMYSLGGRI